MKKFIYKTNQYLLERYPTIWNTRLVWMLLAAATLHLLFFVFGFFTLTNPEMLQERRVTNLFFENGSIFLSVIISILLVVTWIIYMFKNNAFKNFYPTTRLKLFGQFILYLVIVLSCTTFYISYQYGMKTYIASTYSEEQLNKEIEVANDAYLFLSEKLENYTLNQRRFPKPFNELYCETNTRFIYYDSPYMSFEDDDYQFYSLRSIEIPINKSYNKITGSNDLSKSSGYIYSKTTDSIRTYYFKDSVVNVQQFVKTPFPSLYNMSSTFFVSTKSKLRDEYDYNYAKYSGYDYNSTPLFSLRHHLRNKRNYKLLERNDKTEIKQLLTDFLTISNYYKIDHNLTTAEWFNLVYHPNNFEVKNFIRDQAKRDYGYQDVVTGNRTKTQEFYSNRLTDYYYQNNALRNVFENIESVRYSNPLESIHIFLWLAFFFAAIIFIFRITGLKPLLFSILTIGVLTLIISLFAALLFYIVGGNDDFVGYFLMYLVFALSTLIILIPIVFYTRVKKLVVAICLNISMVGFSLYIFGIIGLISMHQQDICEANPKYSNKDFECDTLIERFQFEWSWILFFSAIIFIFFYSKIIKNWKSLPEG